MKVRCEQFGIFRRHAKHHKSPKIAEYRKANGRRELRGVLSDQAKSGFEFTRFRKQRSKGLGCKGMGLVHVTEKWNALVLRLLRALHCDELQVRNEQRAKEVC